MKNIILFNLDNKDRMPLYESYFEKAGFNLLGLMSTREDYDYTGYKKITIENLKTLDFDYVFSHSTQIHILKDLFAKNNLPLNKTRILYYDLNNTQKILGDDNLKHIFYDNYEIKNNKLIHTLKSKSLNGKMLESISNLKDSEKEKIAYEVYESYKKQMRDLPSVPEVYKPGRNWGNFMRWTRPEFYNAVQKDDKETVAKLLKNFLRNCMSSGMYGGEEAFNGFSRAQDAYSIYFECLKIWFAKTSYKEFDTEELSMSPEGGGYGIDIDGKLFNVASFMFHARAVLIKKLLENKKSIVAEIGGGVGLTGYYLAKMSNITYINFDLPDNLISASYYLKATYPDKKILIYDKKMPLTREFLLQYDIVLMPNFMVPYLDDNSVDMFINTISFGEMNYEAICEYYKQIQRCAIKYFYHENLYAPHGDYEGYPYRVFPELEDFKQIYSTASSWTYIFDSSNKNHMYVEQLYEKMA